MGISERAEDLWGNDHAKDYVEKPTFPRNMLVELSNACNHACVFCANTYMKRRIGRIEGGLLRRAMAEARAGGVEEIGFYTTGEPLVHKELEGFTAHARDLGFSYIYISTNGVLATPDRVRALVDAGMNSIKFSINAGTRESYRIIHGKDEWDKVIANLGAAAAYRETSGKRFLLSVSCVVTKQTEHEADALRQAVGAIVDEIYFVPGGSQTGNMSAAMALFSPKAPVRSEGGICPLPFMRLHLTVEGYLTLCCTDYQNYLAVEDLNSQPLDEAWHGATFVEARRMHLEKRLQGTLCGNCWLGLGGPVEPLVTELADRIDFVEFYETQTAGVRARLADEPKD